MDSDSVATFSVDSKSGRELRPYLSSITDKCEQNAADLPKVIVIDGLHHISSPLSDAFDGFLSVDYKSRWLSHTEEVTCMLYGCFFSIYCWCAVYQLHHLAGGNVVSWTLFFIVVLGSLLPFLWNFWDLKMPWKGSILSFGICKFIVYCICHFLRLLMKTSAMPFSVCNLTWVVTSTLRCWYFVVQPIYYWCDESVRRFHDWPAAASQLPLAAVCQSHGTSLRIPPALPATTSSRRRSPWRGPVGCNGRDCPVAAASLATNQPSPRNTRRLWRHCRSADNLLLGIT